MNQDLKPLEEEIGSALKIPHVVFDEVSFHRTGFKNEKSEAKLSIGTQVNKDGEGQYRVTIHLEVQKDKEYNVTVQLTGFCQISESHPHKDVLLRENAVAILFAYARSELTLITSQPEVDPLVLPVVNINAMLQQGKKNVEMPEE